MKRVYTDRVMFKCNSNNSRFGHVYFIATYYVSRYIWVEYIQTFFFDFQKVCYPASIQQQFFRRHRSFRHCALHDIILDAVHVVYIFEKMYLNPALGFIIRARYEFATNVQRRLQRGTGAMRSLLEFVRRAHAREYVQCAYERLYYFIAIKKQQA